MTVTLGILALLEAKAGKGVCAGPWRLIPGADVLWHRERG